MIKGIVNQLEALVLVSSSTGLLETEWSLNWLVSHLLALTCEVLSISLDSLNQIHSMIETGDGPGWAAGYCNIKITGCTRGGKVGEWAEYKDKPEQAPDATIYNAYGYQNSKYFNAADNQ